MEEPLLWEMQWHCRDRGGSSVVGLRRKSRWALQLHLSWLSGDVTDLCLPCVSLCFGKPKYAGVQMAISKVHKAQTFLGMVPRSATPLIQIVLIDDRAGMQAGTAAEQLAADIMESIAQHGNGPVPLTRSPAGAPRLTTGQSSIFPASSPRVQWGLNVSRDGHPTTSLGSLSPQLLQFFIYKYLDKYMYLSGIYRVQYLGTAEKSLAQCSSCGSPGQGRAVEGSPPLSCWQFPCSLGHQCASMPCLTMPRAPRSLNAELLCSQNAACGGRQWKLADADGHTGHSQGHCVCVRPTWACPH